MQKRPCPFPSCLTEGQAFFLQTHYDGSTEKMKVSTDYTEGKFEPMTGGDVDVKMR